MINGQVERVNRIIRPILSKLSNQTDHVDWVTQLLSTEYAINNTIHSSTRFSPSMLLFGVNQRGPSVDILTEYLEDKNKALSDLETIRAEASFNILKSQQNNEKQLA